MFVVAGLAFGALILAACQVTPTPAPTPTPANTRRPTRTPFPTLTPRPQATPTATPVRAVVTDTLRVRESPTTSARILGRLKANQVVFLLSRSDDDQWFAIEYPEGSGQLGWVFGQVLVPDTSTTQLPIGSVVPKPPAGSIFATVKTEGDPLRIRAGPGTSYEVVSRIPDKTRILLIARSPDGDWFQTTYPPDSGQRGWVSKMFLSLEGSTDAMQVLQPPPTPTPGPTPLPQPTRAGNAPAGGTILVALDRDQGSELYALGENGIVRRQLTRGGSADGARFAPDGDRIVFYRTVSTAPNLVSHVFVMDFDGRNLVDLSAIAGGSFSDSDPDWSPDGGRIVFVRTPRAGAPELWMMNRDGHGARMLLRLSAATGVIGIYSPKPRWSPDGGRIAYAAVARVVTPGAPLYPSIFVVNTDRSGERQLTDNDSINTSPVWSPDGRQIAWGAQDFLNRQNWRVWVMNASGADPRVLISSPDGDAASGALPTAWRGNKLLIAGWTGNWDAYLAAAGGGTITPVTSGTGDNMPTDWLP